MQLNGNDKDKGKAKDEKEVEEEQDELMHFYHVTNSSAFANSLTQGKSKGTNFKDLKIPIDPQYRINHPDQDLRGGDDLGPGFYVGNSPKFADYYTGGFSDGSVLKFSIMKSKLKALKQQHNAPDDEDTFQDFMKRGFPTKDSKTNKVSKAELDEKATGNDILSGPINDVSANTPLGKTGDTIHSKGKILKFGKETPLQYNFASKEAAQALYEHSTISATSIADWKKRNKEEDK